MGQFVGQAGFRRLAGFTAVQSARYAELAKQLLQELRDGAIPTKGAAVQRRDELLRLQNNFGPDLPSSYV